MRKTISVDEVIKFLNPESDYVFYDDAHGFCINTQDVLDHILALPSTQLEPNCEGCKHLPRYSHEAPCKTCANNYINKYERYTR